MTPAATRGPPAAVCSPAFPPQPRAPKAPTAAPRAPCCRPRETRDGGAPADGRGPMLGGGEAALGGAPEPAEAGGAHVRRQEDSEEEGQV